MYLFGRHTTCYITLIIMVLVLESVCCFISYHLEQGYHTHFQRGPHQHHGCLLKGQYCINYSNILLNNSLHLIIVYLSVHILYVRTFL